MIYLWTRLRSQGNTNIMTIKKDKLQKTKISNEIYNNILDAPLISYEQFILYTQKQKTLDRDEKIKLQKYYIVTVRRPVPVPFPVL